MHATLDTSLRSLQLISLAQTLELNGSPVLVSVQRFNRRFWFCTGKEEGEILQHPQMLVTLWLRSGEGDWAALFSILAEPCDDAPL